MKINQLVISIIILISFSCKNKVKSEDYVDKVEHSNDCIIKKEVADYIITVIYKPAEYLVIKEMPNSIKDVKQSSEYKKLLDSFSKNLNFEIKIFNIKKSVEGLDNQSFSHLSKIFTYDANNKPIKPVYLQKLKYEHAKWSLIFANQLSELPTNEFNIYVNFIDSHGILQESILSFDKSLLEKNMFVESI